MDRRRSKKLIFIVIIFILFNLISSYKLFEVALQYDNYSISIPEIVIYLLASLALLNAIFLASILYWKKWRLYGFAVSAIIIIMINLAVVDASPAVFYPLVGPVLVYWLVKPIWAEFDGNRKIVAAE